MPPPRSFFSQTFCPLPPTRRQDLPRFQGWLKSGMLDPKCYPNSPDQITLNLVFWRKTLWQKTFTSCHQSCLFIKGMRETKWEIQTSLSPKFWQAGWKWGLSIPYFILVTKFIFLFQFLELCSYLNICSILFKKMYCEPDQIWINLWLLVKKNKRFSPVTTMIFVKNK